MSYSKLFSEGKIGSLSTKNRVVMSAVGISLANMDGTPTDEIIAYYAERAKGGVGLIINEYTRVMDENGGIAAVRQLGLTSDDKIPAFKKMTDAVHAHGAKIFAQLHHAGREGMNAFNEFKTLPAPSVKACALVLQATHAMTIEEIKDMQNRFIDAAVRAEKAGYDGVELHGAHGYLIGQFLSPYSNLRTDEYGGSLENRCRFAVEIIEGIRAKLPNYPISIRLSVSEFLKAIGKMEPCLEVEETVEIAKILEKAGVDIINISSGLYETANTVVEPMSFEEGWLSELVKTVKNAVSIPVMGRGVIRTPEFAEKLLADGSQDFIVMGRTHLADPEWSNKAKEGRECEIRKCISCLHCFETYLGAMGTGVPVECAVNPRTAHETKYTELKQDGNGRVVAVVGAGPAGMEAAITLAKRGFKPVVFEKEAEVGGQLQLANKPPHKDKINWLIENQKSELARLGVEVKYNTEATVENLQAVSPYAVVVATGGRALVPNIPGVDKANVCSSTDILTGKVKLENKKVAVVGSGMTGLETTELLNETGNQCTVVEMLPAIGAGAYMQNLLDVKMRLDAQGTSYRPFHRLDAVLDGKLELTNMASIKKAELETEYVVIALGTASNKELAENLKGKFDKVVSVGDANKVGRIANAIASGYEVAYNL